MIAAAKEVISRWKKRILDGFNTEPSQVQRKPKRIPYTHKEDKELLGKIIKTFNINPDLYIPNMDMKFIHFEKDVKLASDPSKATIKIVNITGSANNIQLFNALGESLDSIALSDEHLKQFSEQYFLEETVPFICLVMDCYKNEFKTIHVHKNNENQIIFSFHRLNKKAPWDSSPRNIAFKVPLNNSN